MAKVLLLSFDAESVGGRVSFFENAGFQVMAAEPSWPSCLQVVKSFEPDVIALDCAKLPSMCRQTGAELRKAPLARDLPLVLFRVADADIEQTRLQVAGGVVAFEYELTDRLRSAILTRVANQARAESEANRAKEEAAASKRAAKEAVLSSKRAEKEAAEATKRAAKEAAKAPKKAGKSAPSKAAPQAKAKATAKAKVTATAKPAAKAATAVKSAPKAKAAAAKASPKKAAASKKATVKRVASKKAAPAPKGAAGKAVAKRPAARAASGRRR